MPIMNGFPLESEPSGPGAAGDPLLGRVVRSTARSHDLRQQSGNPQWESSYRQGYPYSPAAGHPEERLPQQYTGGKINSLQSQSDDTPIVLVSQPNRSPVDHPAHEAGDLSRSYKPMDQALHSPAQEWPNQGNQAKPSLQKQEVLNDPMSTIPKDCRIVKIIPNACGVFAVLYSRNGHPSTGAVIWDGQEVHSMGMFSTAMDAHQACSAASAMAVKLIENGNNSTSRSSVQNNRYVVEPQLQLSSSGRAPPQANLGEQLKKNSGTSLEKPIERKSQESARPRTDNPERRAPQSSPFVSLSADSYIQLVSVPSNEVGLLNKSQLPTSDSATKSQGGKSTQAIADLVSENKGNLGSLLHYDSWSSSILGLISVSVARGGNKGEGDNAGKSTDNPLSLSLGSLPSNLGSLTDLNAFAGQNPNPTTQIESQKPETSELNRMLLDRAEPVGVDEIATLRGPNQGPDGHGASPRSAPSLFVSKKGDMAGSKGLTREMGGEGIENGDGNSPGDGTYNDVLELIVSKDRPNRRKTGNLAPSRAQGDTLDSEEDANWAGLLKRRGNDELTGFEELRRKRARTPERGNP